MTLTPPHLLAATGTCWLCSPCPSRERQRESSKPNVIVFPNEHFKQSRLSIQNNSNASQMSIMQLQTTHTTIQWHNGTKKYYVTVVNNHVISNSNVLLVLPKVSVVYGHSYYFWVRFGVLWLWPARSGVAHLQGHLNKHKKLLDANPHPLALHLFGDAGPLRLWETAQELERTFRTSGDPLLSITEHRETPQETDCGTEIC